MLLLHDIPSRLKLKEESQAERGREKLHKMNGYQSKTWVCYAVCNEKSSVLEVIAERKKIIWDGLKTNQAIKSSLPLQM